MEPALLRQTFKDAILDALRESKNDLSKPEHRGELAELLTDVFEDIGLGFAIDAARHDELVPKDQVLRTLQGGE